MLPITLSLGLINFNLFINSALGATVSEAVPRAIDAAFRLYMLPQGMFSVAVATVLFPALARLSTRRDFDGLRKLTGTGTRQIFLLLIPAAACTLVLAEPITRLVYERGEFGAGLDGDRRRGAVLVLLQPALRRRQPAADADVLLAAAPLAADRPRRRDARRQHRRRARARRPVRDGRHRVRDGGRERRDDRRPGLLPAPHPRRAPRGRRDRARRRRGSSSRRRCWASSPTRCGAASTTLLGRSLPAQIVSVGGGLAAGIAVVLRGRAGAARARGRSRSATSCGRGCGARGAEDQA